MYLCLSAKDSEHRGATPDIKRDGAELDQPLFEGPKRGMFEKNRLLEVIHRLPPEYPTRKPGNHLFYL